MLVPALLPGGSVWIAACFVFINIVVGAQCMIMLRDFITALALVTHFPLHSSCPGSLSKPLELVTGSGLIWWWGSPRILVCGVLIIGATFHIPQYRQDESHAAEGVLQKGSIP